MNLQRVWLVLEFNSACKALLEKFEDFILSGFMYITTSAQYYLSLFLCIYTIPKEINFS